MASRSITRMALAAAAAAWTVVGTVGPVAAEEKFVYGGLLPLTGPAAIFGPGMSAAVELAVKDINAAGGIGAAKAEAVFADDACDANIAAQALDRMLGQGVKAVMGTGCSGVSLSLLDKVSGARVVMCAGANTGPQLTTAPDGGYYFRTSYSNALQGPVLGQLPLEDGHTSIAILGRGDVFGESLAAGVKQAVEASGATVTKYIIYDPNQTAFEAEVAAVAQSKPDAVVAVGRDERGQVFRLLIERGLGPDKVGWYTPGVLPPDFYKLVDPSNPAVIRGTKQTAPPKLTPEGDFLDRIRGINANVTEFLFAPQQYDCAIIAALGAVAANSTDPAAFKDKMVGVTRGDNECGTYADCAALLKAGKSIAYVGPTGPTRMSDVGEPTVARFQVYEVDDKGVSQPKQIIDVGR